MLSVPSRHVSEVSIYAARRVVLLVIAASQLIARPAFGSDLVISQIYGGGGNSGAPYRNDFVELFNRGTNTISFTNWSVQYAPASGSNWQVTAISGTLAPGRYFLLRQGSGGTNGVMLPTPDVTGTISMSGSAGKVALVAGSLPLSDACPLRGDLLDFAGYGTSANCFEGVGPTAAPGNGTAVLRASDGCRDSDENDGDFFVATPRPQNSAAPANICPSVPPPPVALHAIQGTGNESPLSGQYVLTSTNIVTALRDDGFFIQARDVEIDDDPLTSEAIFVSTPEGPPSPALPGYAVAVSGIVVERRPTGDPLSPTRTQLINATTYFLSSGHPLPAPVSLTVANTDPLGSLDQLERFENMRVRVNSLTVVGPTEGFINEASATGISDGVFYGVITGVPRPFRERGISIFDTLPAWVPSGILRFDANPERLRVDSNAQLGASRIEVATGAVFSNLVGVLDFDARLFTILPDPVSAVSVSGGMAPTVGAGRDPSWALLASLNLQRFYDTLDDPAVDDVVLTTNAYQDRLGDTAAAIRIWLNSPHILGIAEVENLATLRALAARANTDPSSSARYEAYLEEGNDIGGIDVGFLVDTSRVSVLSVTQLGKAATYVNPTTGLPELLHDRPPLLLRASITPYPYPRALPLFEVTVIMVHLRSLLNVDDPVDGSRVRAKRQAQAEFVADVIQSRQVANPAELIACLGDFNALPFNDGYVDVLGTIMGRPAPPAEVMNASPDLVEPDLINLLDWLPPSQRYSYVIKGNAQALDHVLVNGPLRAYVLRFGYARLNADFPESLRTSAFGYVRVSDHDAPVAVMTVFPYSTLRSVRREDNGNVLLSWTAAPGWTNTVLANTNPGNLGAWFQIGSAVADGLGRATFIDTNASTLRARFYKLIY